MDAVIGYHEYITIKNSNIIDMLAETILSEKSVSHLSLRERENSMKSIFKN